MVAPTIAAGSPEPVVIDRTTRGGRRLWYHLEVIQQPERARACGAGPKCEFANNQMNAFCFSSFSPPNLYTKVRLLI